MKIRLALHKNVQREITKRLSGQKVSIEKGFLRINRIADLYWHEKKVVFEIQCSHISQSEALQRTKDYQSLGLTIIWLLHDKTFNRRVLTPAERSLRKLGALYTNIDGLKEGVVYNQTDQLIFRTRINRGRPKAVDVLDYKSLLKNLKPQKNRTKFNLKKSYNMFLTKLFLKLS